MRVGANADAGVGAVASGEMERRNYGGLIGQFRGVRSMCRKESG